MTYDIDMLRAQNEILNNRYRDVLKLNAELTKRIIENAEIVESNLIIEQLRAEIRAVNDTQTAAIRDYVRKINKNVPKPSAVDISFIFVMLIVVYSVIYGIKCHG